MNTEEQTMNINKPESDCSNHHELSGHEKGQYFGRSEYAESLHKNDTKAAE